jgi:hypothetical protein
VLDSYALSWAFLQIAPARNGNEIFADHDHRQTHLFLSHLNMVRKRSPQSTLFLGYMFVLNG